MVAEVALALVLLVGAGLLLRSLSASVRSRPGFDAAHVLTMQVRGRAPRTGPTRPPRRRFFDEALDAVRRVPGVSAAAFTSQLPLSGDLDGYGVKFESLPPADGSDVGSALRYAVDARLRRGDAHSACRGRLFDAHDTRRRAAGRVDQRVAGEAPASAAAIPSASASGWVRKSIAPTARGTSSSAWSAT